MSMRAGVGLPSNDAEAVANDPGNQGISLSWRRNSWGYGDRLAIGLRCGSVWGALSWAAPEGCRGPPRSVLNAKPGERGRCVFLGVAILQQSQVTLKFRDCAPESRHCYRSSASFVDSEQGCDAFVIGIGRKGLREVTSGQRLMDSFFCIRVPGRGVGTLQSPDRPH